MLLNKGSTFVKKYAAFGILWVLRTQDYKNLALFSGLVKKKIRGYALGRGYIHHRVYAIATEDIQSFFKKCRMYMTYTPSTTSLAALK